MRRNCRLGSVRSVLVTAALMVLPAFANAQRPPAADSDVFKPSRSDQESSRPIQGRQPVAAPGNRQGQSTPIGVGRRGLVGSPVPGIPMRTDVISPSSTDQVAAGPISNCALNGGGGITCNIFETNAAGNPSEISNVINLPIGVTGGYLVLKDNPAIADSDQTNWSDVLVFAPAAGTATTVQLFSAGCNTANPNDRSCFPTFATVSGDPDSGFINETKGGATVFVASPNIYNIYSIDDNPPDRPFTLATSVGTVDEDSTAIVQLRNFTVTLLPAVTGTVKVRYSITAVDSIARFCPATQSVVRVRYRNTDTTGVGAQVSFEIHSTNITAGGNIILYAFSSNGRSGSAAFTTASDSPAIDFDFANNVYWIEATILRSDPNALSDLGSIQIWEAGGPACP